MKTIEIVDKLRSKLEFLASNKSIQLDELRLLEVLNDSQIELFEYFLDKRNTDDIAVIKNFLVTSKPLKKDSENSSYSDFILPEDFFDLEEAFAEAKKEDCSRKIQLFEAKGRNLEEILNDEFNKPSFEYDETPYLITNNNLRIFRDNFTLENVIVMYYKKPVDMSLEGYIDIHGNETKEVNPDFNRRAINYLIQIAVKNVSIITENFNKAQITTQDITTKF